MRGSVEPSSSFLSTAREGDMGSLRGKRELLPISIHALCERGRLQQYPARPASSHFYPRPLRERATAQQMPPQQGNNDFYPRPLRERATLTEFVNGGGFYEFLSTPSSQRATTQAELDKLKRDISIHALFAEGDCE